MRLFPLPRHVLARTPGPRLTRQVVAAALTVAALALPAQASDVAAEALPSGVSADDLAEIEKLFPGAGKGVKVGQTAPDAAAEPLPSGVSADDLAEIEKLFPGAGKGGPAGQTAQDGPPVQPTDTTPQAGDPQILPRFFQDMNPEISLILDTALAGFSTETPLQSGAHDPRANGFNWQQLEMSAGASVDPYFRFDSNLVFSPFGVEVEEAYATSTTLPANLQIRAGQFLTKFGRINNSHPHAWQFLDQPLVIGKFFGGEGNRGLGAELSWLTPLPWYAEWITSATDATGDATARSFYGRNSLGVRSPFDLQLTTMFKQFFPLSSDLSLAWGLSGAFGPNGTGRANRSEVYGTDLYVRYRPLEGENVTIIGLNAEAIARRRQVPGDVLTDAGGYFSAFWQFAIGWAAAARYELVSGLASDYLDPEWTGQRQRWAANLTWWPTEFSRVRLQGSIDQPSWRQEPIYGGMLGFEVVTGAHGAHAF
jgi:hypothetical protein